MQLASAIFRRTSSAVFWAAFYLLILSPSLSATELENEKTLSTASAGQRKLQESGKNETDFVTLDEQVDKQNIQQESFTLLNESVEPGTIKQINWPVTLRSIRFNIPIIIAHAKMQSPG